MNCGFGTEGDFRTVDAINAWIAARSTHGGGDRAAGQKPQFHQALGERCGEIDAVQDSFFAVLQVGEGFRGSGLPVVAGLLDTQLQHAFIMSLPGFLVNAANGTGNETRTEGAGIMIKLPRGGLSASSFVLP